MAVFTFIYSFYCIEEEGPVYLPKVILLSLLFGIFWPLWDLLQLIQLAGILIKKKIKKTNI